ncbi:MAG TPA: hypothetical protein VH414_19865 [Lichenihabitans sp.]|jgi:hypothetical protein|nr:hypothetical protein [Lichenihabitans sp.]
MSPRHHDDGGGAAAGTTLCPTRRRILLGALLSLGVGLGAIAPTLSAAARETAVAPETNPPGDIPDDQVFIVYTAPQGFAIKVPEGWARTDRPDGVSFADKYDSVDVAVTSGPAPTVASVRAGEAATMEKTGHAVKIGSIKSVTLPSGEAVRIAYTSNSEPNPVTNRRIRQENERTIVGHAGKVATLTMSAPAGADNVDQWKLMNDSFRWK